MPESRTILVLGGTGLMGREVLAALARMGRPARVLVRDPSRLADARGLDVRIGDLRDPASLREAMTGVDAVFHISPHEADEVALARAVVTACESEGARLVFAGIHLAVANPVSGWLMRRFYEAIMPRYRGKFEIGRMVERSATRPVILAPSNFMQNDEVLLSAIDEGLFVHPCSPKGLNRVDLRDLGEIAARILTDASFPAGRYAVVGPRSLTGPECAAVWERELGRPVRYAGDDDAALLGAIDRHVDGYRREDWRATLKKLRTFALHASESELATTARLLGRAPTDYVEFVRRVVAEHPSLVAAPAPRHAGSASVNAEMRTQEPGLPITR